MPTSISRAGAAHGWYTVPPAVGYDDEAFNSLDTISESPDIVLCEVAPKFD
jgi:hypothetical protein